MKKYVKTKDLTKMLEEDKHIIPGTLNERIFLERSYDDVINPYKDYICVRHEEGEHREYPNEVNFRIYKQLNMIDDFIACRLYTYIKCFESALKANLIIVFSEKMIVSNDLTCANYSLFKEVLKEGENQLGMLDIYHCYHNTKIIRANEMIERKNREVIEKVLQLGTENNNLYKYSYEHYQSKYHMIPIWIVLKQLTFGELQTLFNLLKLKDRIPFVTQICGERKNNRYISSFSNKINYIRILRNMVCHCEPVMPFINNRKTEEEKHRLIYIVRMLKKNYYESEIHDNSKIVKPEHEVKINMYNLDRITYLEWILKVI